MSPCVTRVLFVGMWALLSACASDTLTFRVLALTDPDPYVGADHVLVALEQDGVVVPMSGRPFAVDEAEWRLDGWPFGQGLQLRVEVRSGALVLARGRSFPFDALEHAPPDPVDVTLGALGRFGTSIAMPLDPPRAILPTPEGAIWASESGEVMGYLAHAEGPHAGIVRLASGPVGASWTGIDEVGLLAIRDGVATVFDPEGRVVATLTDPALGALGTAPVACALGAGAIAIGPPDSPSIVRIEYANRALSAHRIGALPMGASVALTSFEFAEQDERLVAVGPTGGWLVTPQTGEIVALPSGAYPAQAAVVAVERGLVAIVGGEVSGQPIDTITMLVLRADAIQELLAEPLFAARRDAGVIPMGDGLVLILGGIGDGGPVAIAEILDRTGLGEVSPTGTMPAVAARVVGTRLKDGSVLVVGDAGIDVYFIPR